MIVVGLVLFFLVIIVAATGGYWYWQATEARVAIDRTTLCPVDGPIAVTVVLLDRTDPLNPIQKEDLSIQIRQIVADVPRYGKLELYTIEPIEDQPLQARYAMCNPGRGAEIDPTIGNPRRVEEMWRTGFQVPLNEALADLMKTGAASSSPIMESIQSVAVTEFGGRRRPDVRLRLILASDMLHFTAGYSQYRGIEDFERFRSSPYYRKVRADLRGVDVDILYVQRSKQMQLGSRKHISFWEDYFSDQGASVALVRPIKG